MGYIPRHAPGKIVRVRVLKVGPDVRLETDGKNGLRTVDDFATGAPVAAISHGLWQRRFGGDREVLGRTIRTREGSFTVVGARLPTARAMTPAMMRPTLEEPMAAASWSIQGYPASLTPPMAYWIEMYPTMTNIVISLTRPLMSALSVTSTGLMGLSSFRFKMLTLASFS